MPGDHVAAPPERPLLVWDGDCGFCRRWVNRWQARTGDRVGYEPYQEAAARFPEIPAGTFAEAVHLVEPDGRVSRGAEAVFRALSYGRGQGKLRWAYETIPGVSAVAEAFYSLVAAHRRLFSTLTRLLWGRHLDPPAYHISGTLFLRLIGLVYLIAFVSLWVQIHGLIGSRGILPIGEFLGALAGYAGPVRYWSFPTLCWISPSDSFLGFQCGAGVVFSLLVLAGVAQAPCLFLNWVLYLSLVTAGREFLSFQWDNLLLETGLLAVFAAPVATHLSLVRAPEPPRGALCLERWLLLRLMLGSGIVKLASGDPTWRGLTALRYHYETQPLPTWIAWYAHQLPSWFQSFSVVAMFVVELFMPLLIFLPRRPRLLAFGCMVFLQTLIALTGNYCFFNVLAVVLCLLLVDDAAWPRTVRERFSSTPALARGAPARWPGRLLVPVGVMSFFFGALLLLNQAAGRLPWPAVLQVFYGPIAPARSLNQYGLFMVMTTSRPEILVEGSTDGETWSTYEFKWKPGDPTRRPGFVEPHQPRLDWQMWFAALGTVEENRWLVLFLGRLLEGSPQVLALLGRNPFAGTPPRYVRAVTYDYHFTDLETRAREGAWWRRTLVGPYSPVFSLSPGRRGEGDGKPVR